MPEPAESLAPRHDYTGELVSAASALTLLLLMFLAEWFGVDLLPGRRNGIERATAENAWHGLTVLRWLMLLTIIVALGSLVLHVTQRSQGTANHTGGIVAGLGTLTAILLIYRVLIDLPSAEKVVDQKLGAILGVLSAIGVALGGHASMRQERAGMQVEHGARTSTEGLAEQARDR